MKNRVRRIFEKLDPKPEALVLVNATDPHLDQSFFYVFDTPSGLFEGSVAVAYPDGRLHVLSSLLEEQSAREAMRHDPDTEVSAFSGKDEWERLVRELVPAGETIALNYRELTHADFLSLDGLLPSTKWTDATAAIRQARRVKDAAEIERLERAGAIASEVAREIPGYLKRGLSELALAAEIEYQMSRRGAAGRSFATIAAFGSNGAEPHYAPQDRRLEPGASLVCDFGALFRRYASDITRSFRFGPRDDELKRVHDTVLEAQNAALDQVRAGVPGREVHLAAQRVIDASPWRGRFIHGVGHSIGLAVHDGFQMNGHSDDPLEAGMTVTVEPGVYLPGRGGVRIEDDILVTESGYRFLTTAPRDYLEVGG